MDVYTSGEASGDVELKVNTASSVKLFNILIESYKNSRASMIREYVSNAWDAHRVMGYDNTKPVVVRISEDDAGKYIEFIDEGVGMSKEFFYETYASLLTSTKENSNNEIGGFGIGSKTALAYTNYYYVTSVQNGIKNEFAVYREASSAPKLSLLSTQSTEEHNGTKVKVYLKEGHNEERTMLDTAVKELAYFDNVVIEYCFDLDNATAWTYNNGKIIEGEHFKFKSLTTPYADNIHMVLGQVAYKIDYSELGLDSVNYRLPIAIKLNIGDLQVHMNRETVIYSDEAKEMIIHLLNETVNEVQELYNKNNKTTIEYDLPVYLDKVYNIRSENAVKITLLKDAVNNIYFFTSSKIIKQSEPEFILNKLLGCNINLPDNYRRYQVGELIKEIDNKISSTFFYVVAEFRDGKMLKRISSNSINRIENRNVIIIKKDSELTAITKDKYFLKYHNNGIILKQRNTKDALSEFKFLYFSKEEVITCRKFSTDEYESDWQINEYTKIVHVPGLKTRLYAFYKYYKKKVLDKTLKVIYYNKEIELVPKAYIEKVKLEEREARNKIYRAEGVIPCRIIHRTGEATLADFDLAQLNRYKGIVVYGTKNERDLLQKIAILLEDRWGCVDGRKHIRVKTDRSKSYKIIQIASNNETPFTKFPNTINANLFFMSQHKLITQLYTANLITEKYSLFIANNINFIKNVNTDVHKDLLELKRYGESYYSATSIVKNIMKELNFIANRVDLIDYKVADTLKRVETYFEGIEFLLHCVITDSINAKEESRAKYVYDSDTSEIKSLIELLKSKNKKIHYSFYNNTKQPEKEIKTIQKVTRFIASEPVNLKEYDRNIRKPIELNKYLLTQFN